MTVAGGRDLAVWTPASRGGSGTRQSTRPLWLATLALAAAGVGALDVATGPELLLAPLYVPLVISSARRGGRIGAGCAALGCTALGIVADHLASDPFLALATSYTVAAMPWWNGLARLMVYLIVGWTVVQLQEALRERRAAVLELQLALDQVRTLEGLLPICAWCKQIRDEEQGGVWLSVESYIARKTSAQFTHGICPECVTRMQVPKSRQ